jgi:hypothetical protein
MAKFSLLYGRREEESVSSWLSRVKKDVALSDEVIEAETFLTTYRDAMPGTYSELNQVTDNILMEPSIIVVADNVGVLNKREKFAPEILGFIEDMEIVKTFLSRVDPGRRLGVGLNGQLITSNYSVFQYSIGAMTAAVTASNGVWAVAPTTAVTDGNVILAGTTAAGVNTATVRLTHPAFSRESFMNGKSGKIELLATVLDLTNITSVDVNVGGVNFAAVQQGTVNFSYFDNIGGNKDDTIDISFTITATGANALARAFGINFRVSVSESATVSDLIALDTLGARQTISKTARWADVYGEYETAKGGDPDLSLIGYLDNIITRTSAWSLFTDLINYLSSDYPTDLDGLRKGEPTVPVNLSSGGWDYLLTSDGGLFNNGTKASVTQMENTFSHLRSIAETFANAVKYHDPGLGSAILKFLDISV